MNVLLVEDNIDLATTVVEYLQLEAIHCDHASNGVQGLQLICSQHYDVIIVDINLPRMDGFSLCQSLREKGNDTPVIMLTARDQLSDKLEGFTAGTDDYLAKPFEFEELLVRLHALARRRSGQVQQLQYSDLTMNLGERSVARNGQVVHLSPSGWKLLELLLRAAPNAVSKNRLELALWGDETPDSNALKVHLFNLRKSIDTPFSRPLIHTVVGHGFALREGNKNDENP